MATDEGVPVNPVFPGDPFGHIKEAKYKRFTPPHEVNEFHTRSDNDTSATAQHHTLGLKHNQASPGDHVHDGTNSKFLMDDVTITGATAAAALRDLLGHMETKFGLTDNTTF